MTKMVTVWFNQTDSDKKCVFLYYQSVTRSGRIIRKGLKLFGLAKRFSLPAAALSAGLNIRLAFGFRLFAAGSGGSFFPGRAEVIEVEQAGVFGEPGLGVVEFFEGAGAGGSLGNGWRRDRAFRQFKANI